MRITRGQLRRIIKEEAARLREVGEHPKSWMRPRRTASAGTERLRKLAASLGYKFQAPYSWGYDEDTGDELEDGAVKFDAAITDDYGDWVVGLQGGTVTLHTVDDDIDMTLAELEGLLADNSLDDLLEMSEDEIRDLMEEEE